MKILWSSSKTKLNGVSFSLPDVYAVLLIPDLKLPNDVFCLKPVIDAVCAGNAKNVELVFPFCDDQLHAFWFRAGETVGDSHKGNGSGRELLAHQFKEAFSGVLGNQH